MGARATSAAVRVRTAQAWQSVLAGAAPAGVRHVTEAHRLTRATNDDEGRAWVGGAGGLLLAVVGAHRQALDLSRAAGRGKRPRWPRLEELRAAVHLGNRCYAGPAPDLASVPELLPDCQGPELEPFTFSSPAPGR